MKQSFLTFCLLATFTDTGESVSCETCFGMGQTCEGTSLDCPPNTDTCGIIQLRSSGVFEEDLIWKTCFLSKYCNESHRSIDFGITGQMLIKTTCCMGKECEVIPSLPPINTTPNGKKCLACSSMTKRDCKGVVAECTGDHTDCADLRVTGAFGYLNKSFVLKGCTNYHVCRDTLLGFSEGFITGHCVISSGPPIATPRSLLLFVQTFSGLLLLKIHL
ncbi:PREDICTED: phospholipase A2 inhibitor subunit gamma B-like [Gekko japonicus]|uniref:Phospholipase A2 inhibitor subunit gamma B-like n=1 Tax=Gekko japonicus TaxID=146911 RepID=A0ABM1KLG5_GEKJA|nr:PREDICTED: phospholipase A2 inhibitor subunit gamma B-like [Gekko japonicus]